MQSAPFPFHPFLAPLFLITLPGPLFGLIPGRGSRKKERLESWSDRRAIVAVSIGGEQRSAGEDLIREDNPRFRAVSTTREWIQGR